VSDHFWHSSWLNMANRLPVRLLSRQLRSQCPRRTFTSTSSTLEAHNLSMPAMSPTMTEGNISAWKVKEGDSFSTGDILLEIETDKASMDVEAQDDGIMAKIFTADGSKAVKVGTRIAVLADPGDDISQLEIPKDDSQPVESVADNMKGSDKGDSNYESSGAEKDIKGTPQNKRPSRDNPKTSPVGAGQNPKYPLYPSVIALIHENHLSDDDVFKITATGPGGRLLKGDILAHLGSIQSDYPSKQSKRIEHLGHLDLSNIKLAPKQDSPQPPRASAKAEPEVPKSTSVSLSISLSEVLKAQQRIETTLGVSMPLTTFLARAVDLANEDLPIPKGSKPSSNDLFNAILGLGSVPTSSRGAYLPQIDALPTTPRPRATGRSTAQKPDIIDILSGKATQKRAAPTKPSASTPSATTTSSGATNQFTLTVPVGEEKRARTFLERMKTVLQVEPGRLVL